MEVKFLRLLISISTIFIVTDLLLSHEHISNNCSLTKKLSTNVIPITYIVNLVILPHHQVIHGSTDITIEVKELTTDITLNARNMDVDFHCTVIMKPDQPPGCFETETIAYALYEIVYCPKNEILTLRFSEFITPGVHVLHIQHDSRFNDSLNKIIFPYSLDEYEKRWLITNIYDPNSTRALFPCWDDPNIQSHFEIIIKHERLFTCFLSVPVRYDLYREDDKKSTYFIKIHPISTYHLAFMMVYGLENNFEKRNISRLWHESYKNKLFKYANEIIHLITSNFENNMNVILSKEIIKIDYIVLLKSPMKAAAKLGLVLYREKDINFDENLEFRITHLDYNGRKIDVAKLISYEIARQLFLGYIKNISHDLWIKEMLASYYSFSVLDEIQPKARAMDLFVVQNLQTALDSDIYLESKPIFHKAKGDRGINELLYSLLYHKKAFVLMRMLYHLLTPHYFLEAIKEYVQSRSDFWTAFWRIYIHKNNNEFIHIKEIMDSWLTNKHHPEMHFYRDYDKKTVELSVNCSYKVCKFQIPFTYITGTTMTSYETSNVTWYNESERKLLLDIESNSFLLVNMEQVGYYRVNYDRRNWVVLSTYLATNIQPSIPVLNRAQIVNDAFYFTTAGNIEPEVFFHVIKFLKTETDYIPWYPMFNVFSYMSSYLTSPLSNVTKTNFLFYINSLISNIGYDEQVGEDDMTKTLRLLAIRWSCQLGSDDCRSTMREKLKYLIKPMSKSITVPRTTDWLYCIGMMNVSMNYWNATKNNGIKAKDTQIYKLLSCAERKTIILHYLDSMLNSDAARIGMIKETWQNMAKEYLFVIKKHVRKNVVLRYVLQNYKKAVIRFPEDFKDNILMAHIIMNMNTHEQLDKVIKYLSEFLDNQNERDTFNTLITYRRTQIINMLEKFQMFENNRVISFVKYR